MADDFTVEVDSTRAQLKFDVLPDEVRASLFGAAKALNSQLVSLVRSRASGGVVGVKSGEYLHSIRASTRQSRNKVTATTRSRSPLAHIIEGGAKIKAHEILPKTAKALHFTGSVGEVFAARVMHPGVTLPARQVFTGAFAEMEPAIVAGLEQAARDGAHQADAI